MKKAINIEDLRYINIGCGLKGSGGGGSTEQGDLPCRAIYRENKQAYLVPFDSLQDDQKIVFMGLMGAPAVGIEKIPSKEEWSLAFTTLQDYRNEKYQIIAPVEFAGANGPFAIAIAAELASSFNVVLADLDTMGRAYPRISDAQAFVNNTYHDFVCALACGDKAVIVTAVSAEELEDKAREATIAMGGVAIMAIMPMTVKQVKEKNYAGLYVNCVPHSISTSLAIGKALCAPNPQDAIQQLNETLKHDNMGYHSAQIVLSGRITDVFERFDNGFNIGYFEIANSTRHLRIFFKNENLAIYDLQAQKWLDTVPTIISLFDKEMEVISCGNYRVGMEVSLFTLQVPASMCGENVKLILKAEMQDLIKNIEEMGINVTHHTATPKAIRDRHLTDSFKSTMPLSFFQQDETLDGSPCLWMDVGGTNTHIVLASRKSNGKVNIVTAIDTPTSTDITSGVITGIQTLFLHQDAAQFKNRISSITLGTTHFVNSVLEARGINPVLVLMLGRPVTTAIPPLTGWPEELRKLIGDHVHICDGGINFSGDPIRDINESEIRRVILAAKNAEIKHAAIIGVFAMLKSDQENAVAEWCREAGMHVTCSSQLGDIGLIKRANTAILNAGLQTGYDKFLTSIKAGLQSVDLSHCELLLSQNDGTCKPAEKALPIFTFGSGTTNSMIGGSLLADAKIKSAGMLKINLHNKYQRRNVVMVDVGGSSTDVGGTIAGIPVSTFAVKINDIPCNMQGALKYSIPLGGGSAIEFDDEVGIVSLAKRSVAHELKQKALIFGGNTLTLTDIAVVRGRLQIEGAQPSLVTCKVSQNTIDEADNLAHQRVVEVINQFLPKMADVEDIELLFAGGGAALFDQQKILDHLIRKFNKITIPKFAKSANAIGAGGGKISGTALNLVYYGDDKNKEQRRQDAKIKAKKDAIKNAIENGADPNAEFHDQQIDEMELHYLPKCPTRLIYTVVGERALNPVKQDNLQSLWC